MKRTATLLLFSLISIYSIAQTIYNDRRDGEIYFKFKDGYKWRVQAAANGEFSINELPQLQSLFSKYGVTRAEHSFWFAKEANLRQIIRLYFTKAAEVDDFIRDLSQLPFAEYAEHVPLFKTTLTPNDMGTNSVNNGTWALYRISAQQAWDISTGSTNVKVAIVDDAVQTNHTDLAANMLAGWDAALGNNNPNPPTTAYSHGTHVAGCASAVSNNGTGVASIGYSVKIIPVKATNSASSISHGYEGVTWASNNGADVINMSWGGTFGGQTGANIINAAFNNGIVLVAAAGNDGNTTTFYPAGYTNVIAVASTSSTDAKSSFSNYGSWVDVSAPGSRIRSTIPTNTYAIYDGTSMASPIVAGLCGLVLSVAPNFTPTQVRNCITSTADNINSVNSNFVGQLGAGRINAYQAVLCAQGSVVQFDAGIKSITTPAGSSCSNSFTPQVVLKNFGSNALTSVAIQYRIDNGTLNTFNWTGNLASQGEVTVNLPSQTTTTGAHTFTANTTATLNGNQTDANANNNSQTNNFTVFGSPGIALPFSESFESNSLATNNWTIENPDNSLTWELFTTAGTTPGNKSIRLPFFSYQTTGQRDGIITPPLNFTGFDTVRLRFEHAYRRYNTNSSDSLIIYVSTNCGSTWTRIFARGENGTGTFATINTSTTDFVPANADDWCISGTVGSACYTINLSNYIGNAAVRLKFEGFNNYGNNLYLDNINITGVQAGEPPVAQFTATPTTVCSGTTVAFTNQSTNQPTSYQWTFPGGNPASSTVANPSVKYDNPGTYNVTLTAFNAFGQDIETKTAYITVNPKPDVTATFPQNICDGDEVNLIGNGAQDYVWTNGLSNLFGDTITLTANGTVAYQLVGTDANGCKDTTNVTITSSAKPVATLNSVSPICSGNAVILNASGGSNYTWSSGAQGNSITVSPTSTTTYVVSVSFNNAACFDTAAVTIQVKQPASLQLNQTICSGNSYSFNGQQLTQTGNYIANLSTVAGCDSVVTLNLTVLPEFTTSISQQICSGSSYNFNGQQLTQSGNYTATFVSANGCDSTINLSLSVVNTLTTTLSETICADATFTFNGQEYSQSGVYTAQYTSVSGCDSIVTLNLTVNSLPQPGISAAGNELSTQSFESYQWQLNGNNIPGANAQQYTATQNGNYTVVVTNSSGCVATSAVINVTGVSISNVDGSMLNVLLYPNPTESILYIKTNVADEFPLYITDMQGRIIMQTTLQQGTVGIDIRSLASGIYQAVIKVAGGVAVQRFTRL